VAPCSTVGTAPTVCLLRKESATITNSATSGTIATSATQPYHGTPPTLDSASIPSGPLPIESESCRIAGAPPTGGGPVLCSCPAGLGAFSNWTYFLMVFLSAAAAVKSAALSVDSPCCLWQVLQLACSRTVAPPPNDRPWHRAHSLRGVLSVAS